MNIAGRKVGPGEPVFITAEISCNHMGEFDRAVRLIDTAKATGSDGVKFQCFALSEILALRGTGMASPPWEAYTKYDLYLKALTPFAWFPDLFAHARNVGIIPFASVFGPVSLAVLEAVDCPAYKITKYERHNSALIDAALGTGKPVIVSAPYWYDAYVPSPVGVLYCPGGYPATPDTVDLATLCDEGTDWLGLSSHCLAPELPAMAVACGASMLEYHLMEPDTTPLDAAFSHTPGTFRDMVQSVRMAERLMGRC